MKFKTNKKHGQKIISRDSSKGCQLDSFWLTASCSYWWNRRISSGKKTASARPETSKKAPGIPRIPAPEHPVLLGDFIRPHGVAGFDTGGLWRPLQWPWTKHPKKRGVCNGSQVHLNFIDTFVPFWFNHASNRSESADVLQKKTSNTNGYTKAILRSMYGMFTYMYH